MTAVQPATPGSDGEVCQPEQHPESGCDALGHGPHRPAAPSEPPAYITSPALLRDPLLRPPSEPPAADSPTPGNTDPDLGPIDPDVWADFETTCEPPAEAQHPYMLADTPAEFERTKRIAAARHQAEAARLVPAEAQQDDEPEWVEPFYRWAKADKSPGSYSAAFAAGWAAARPSADTETLRALLAAAEQRGYERAQNECPPGGWESGL